jgi:hypothetical protein
MSDWWQVGPKAEHREATLARKERILDQRAKPIPVDAAAFCRIFSNVVLASKRVYARRQTRKFSRDRVFVKHSLSDRPVQLRLRQLKR